MQKKIIDFYEILGVSRGASESEIEGAYDRLMQQLESDGHGLDAKRLGQRTHLLNQAYWALSDKARRASYDASLAGSPHPLQFSVEVQEPRWRSPKGILNIVGRLIVMGLLIQIGFWLVGYYIVGQANGDFNRSENARIVDGYEAINKKLTPEDRAAAEALAEKHKQEAEAEQARQEQERQENVRRQVEWELERNRHYAEQVSSTLRDTEERERYKAAEEQRRLAEIEREKQEREQERLDRLREKWRAESTNNRTPTTGNDDEG